MAERIEISPNRKGTSARGVLKDGPLPRAKRVGRHVSDGIGRRLDQLEADHRRAVAGRTLRTLSPRHRRAVAKAPALSTTWTLVFRWCAMNSPARAERYHRQQGRRRPVA
ncbi:hypothetical protein NKJ40_26775 [Mesorhizobium sp. M0119]|uniref:hypothetical protein n=1 Tax=unclassified Mesorhizobium TaxID=325217 RepID=UPI0033380537